MPTIKITIEIEAGEATQTSISLEKPKHSAGTPILRVGAIDARVRRLVNEFGDNEKAVVKAALQAQMQGTTVYRKQMMPKLGFDQLLQFNGVLAWITRKYRNLVGEPNSYLVETVYEEEVDDYRIEFQPEMPEDVLNALKAYLELT